MARLSRLAIAFYVLHLLGAIASLAAIEGAPTGGFVLLGGGDRVIGFAATQAAVDALQNHTSPGVPFTVESVNGVPACQAPGHCAEALVKGALHLQAGAVNQYRLHLPGKPKQEVKIPAGQVSLAVLLQEAWRDLLMQFVAFIFVAIGLLVWRLRPEDPSAFPLLIMTTLVGVVCNFIFEPAPWATLINTVGIVITPLIAPTALLLVDSIRPRANQRWLLIYFALMLAYGLVHGGVYLAMRWQGAAGGLFDGIQAGLGILMIISITVAGVMSWRAARPPAPLGLQRRARVLSVATVVSFLFPSLWVLAIPFFGALLSRTDLFLLLPASLVSFPMLIAYAIVRHQMFDMRIVIHRSLLYGALTLTLSVVYAGLVVGAHMIVGERSSQSPVFVGLSMIGLIAVFSLLKVKVQRWVDRLVFRAREIYAKAIADAASKLARAHDLDEVASTLRGPLVSSMELSRAWLCVWASSQKEHMRVFPLADPGPLPRMLRPQDYETMRRALDSLTWTTAYDSQAAAAQTSAKMSIEDPLMHEQTFWAAAGAELIVPIVIGKDRAVGLLILGPKRNGRPFDREDRQLVDVLAAQVAVAVENTAALQEIRVLKEGLEEKQALLARLVAGIVHEVNTPLGVLRSSADTLGRTFERMLEADAKKAQRLVVTSRKLSEAMRGSSDRIVELIESLKGFVNLDEAEYKEIDVKESLDASIKLLGEDLGAIEIERAYCDAPAFVECFPVRLNQVFWHLLQNSTNALGDRGRVRIAVTNEAGKVSIVIEDDGPGIPPDQLDGIFEFGFSAKKRGRRMGLRMGLPTSKRTIEGLGGTLKLHSAIGEGTRVMIELPGTSKEPVEGILT